MDEQCGNCKWYSEFDGVCCNPNSEYGAEFMDKDCWCESYSRYFEELL